MQSDLKRQRNLTTWDRRQIHHCWSRLRHSPFSFFLFLNSFRHRNTANQAEIFGANEERWNGQYWTNEEDYSTRHEWNYLWLGCLRFGVWSQCNGFGFLWVQIDSVKQPIQSNSVGPWDMSHRGTSAFDNHLNHGLIVVKTYNVAPAPECVVLDEMRSNVSWNDVGVLELDGGLCMFGSVACNGSLRSFCLGCLILLGAEWILSITKSHKSKGGNTVHA